MPARKSRKKKKSGAKRSRKKCPTLADAMAAVQARKQKKCSDAEWHLLSSIEGSLRKLKA